MVEAKRVLFSFAMFNINIVYIKKRSFIAIEIKEKRKFLKVKFQFCPYLWKAFLVA